MIGKEWNLFFAREDGWWGSAEKNSMVAKIVIRTYGSNKRNYPTFEDCYAVLEEKVNLYEETQNVKR